MENESEQTIGCAAMKIKRLHSTNKNLFGGIHRHMANLRQLRSAFKIDITCNRLNKSEVIFPYLVLGRSQSFSTQTKLCYT